MINPLNLPSKTGIVMGDSENFQIVKLFSDLQPLKQTKEGIDSSKVDCRMNLKLMVFSDGDSPICVKPSSIEKLETLGWNLSSLHFDELVRLR